MEGTEMEITKLIYIVTDGSYSDYKICGVFDDPELAKEFQDAGGYENIEEFPLNPTHPYFQQLKEGWDVFEVVMQKNGDTLECQIANRRYIDWKLPRFGWVNYYYDRGDLRNSPDGYLDATVLARNEEHAIKIVNEKRVQFIAENKWGKD